MTDTVWHIVEIAYSILYDYRRILTELLISRNKNRACILFIKGVMTKYDIKQNRSYLYCLF
jgi:hypothetical protein